MKEHAEGNGANATSQFFYHNLVGLYKLGHKDDVNNRLDIENEITLQIMKLQNNPVKVRGGNWCKHGLNGNEWDMPLKKLKECEMPVVCDCKLPANKIISKNGEVYYKCAISSADWINEEDFPLNIAESCKFFKSEKYAKKEDEPNFCKTCNIPCGNFLTCYTHKPCIVNNRNLNFIEIV